MAKIINAVSVRKDGSLYLFKDVYRRMGEPQKVRVMINEEQSMILLSPSDEEEDDIYNVNKSRSLYIKDIYRVLGYKIYPIGRKKIDFCDKDVIIYLKEKFNE